MNAKNNSLLRNLVNLHNDEEGMEAVQVVAIVAIAAIVLIFVKTVLWPQIQKWAKTKTEELTSD
jgi:hypothetical protein